MIPMSAFLKKHWHEALTIAQTIVCFSHWRDCVCGCVCVCVCALWDRLYSVLVSGVFGKVELLRNEWCGSQVFRNRRLRLATFNSGSGQSPEQEKHGVRHSKKRITQHSKKQPKNLKSCIQSVRQCIHQWPCTLKRKLATFALYTKGNTGKLRAIPCAPGNRSMGIFVFGITAWHNTRRRRFRAKPCPVCVYKNRFLYTPCIQAPQKKSPHRMAQAVVIPRYYRAGSRSKKKKAAFFRSCVYTYESACHTRATIHERRSFDRLRPVQAVWCKLGVPQSGKNTCARGQWQGWSGCVSKAQKRPQKGA